MKNPLVELFGHPADAAKHNDWATIVRDQECPYLQRKCIKVRKSQPAISIGTCAVRYGRDQKPIIICPLRLLERRQVFTDSLHLLTLHRPGNELHVVPEMSIPGGSVDYFLVSVTKGKPVDFVGIELQTLDTTGTVWPARERFLKMVGVSADEKAVSSQKTFGMNWKMTAKTILVQLHHKVETFESISKHLVLASQDCLLNYMRTSFSFGHIAEPNPKDATHFHAYALEGRRRTLRIQLSARYSTNAAGIATALGLRAQARVKVETILSDIQRKISEHTLWTPA